MMKKDIKNELICLGTMLATMILLSCAYMFYMNETKLINDTQDKNFNIVAYLNIGLSEEKAKLIGLDLQKITGVKDIQYRSKEEAIERARSISPILVEGYTMEELTDIYQPYYVITFDDMRAINIITGALKKLDGIGTTEDDIEINAAAQSVAIKAERYRLFAIVIMIYIIEFSIFLMMNTTKLMVFSKRKEISIMKYVGAKDDFIKAPFAFQGIVTAMIAVGITIVAVSIVYPLVIKALGGNTLGGFTYIEFESVYKELLMILAMIGFLIGFVGSTVSMNKYLDV